MLYSLNTLAIKNFRPRIQKSTKRTLLTSPVKASIDTAERALVIKPRDMALALLEEMAADLDGKWGGGEITASAYDAAWVAMVRDPYNPQQLAFPDSLKWLLIHQAMDGKWGDLFPYTLVSTLAALLALLKAPEQTEQICYGAKQAEAYLQHALCQWPAKEQESINIEILVLNLLRELEKLGVAFEFPKKDELLQLSSQRLLIDNPKLIYNGQSNLISSLEAFAPFLDFKRLKQQQLKNGSYGCSSAATAAVLIYSPEWDSAAAEWLIYLSNRAFDDTTGAVPTAYPIDTFEGAWVLYNLAQGGFNLNKDFPQPLLQKLVRSLQDSLTHQGVSFNCALGEIFTNSDNTGIVMAALNKVGVEIPRDYLVHFDRLNYFACYDQQKGTSVSANAHVLAALLSLSDSARSNLLTNITGVVNLLYSLRDSRGFWEDKNHLSPFYATACAVMAIAEHEEFSLRYKLQPTIEWVLQTQSTSDGGWGYGARSTLEETAYALQILQSVPDLVELSDHRAYKRAIHRGIGYLWQHFDEFSANYDIKLPKLWRYKELYVPVRVVYSAVVGVMHRFGV
ncbi:hypothetical protein LC653_36380 [Nostoc sp. CHAB 5784]|uniref:hypothetical protein n=1 Tax=Nostoc mirabile TaxID=2907820 RepID=UPI001E55868A|nr:hypothetical protein [Nostoc mirabile]MCC5669179.1 hypothetical protein [Nostoc mirabile CHAB5784]